MEQPEQDRAEMLTRRIEELWARTDPDTIVAVEGIVGERSARIAGAFYSQLLEVDEARHFLDNELVRSRLNASMQRWLCDLLSASTASRADALVERLHGIGMLHVRINLPWHLLSLGMRIIRTELFGLLMDQGWDRDRTVEALLFSLEMLEIAAEGMNGPFFEGVVSNARYQQSLRVMMTGHGLAMECERLRATLLEWHRDAVVALFEGRAPAELPPLASTDVGLWLAHKAAFSIGEVPELSSIAGVLEQTDGDLHRHGPGQPGTVDRPLLKLLNERVATLAYLLSSVSEKALEAESGRDALTRLLNRRYLPSILQQEVSFSQRHGRPFALLLIDADHFKQVNDSQGHQVGDEVLIRLAQRILSLVRTSDYLFRYGGEEFLVLLSEVDLEIARRKAEEILTAVAALGVVGDEGLTFKLTVSIGVALHDGHPDFERVVRAADQALIRAKREGRNRVVVWEGPGTHPEPEGSATTSGRGPGRATSSGS